MPQFPGVCSEVLMSFICFHVPQSVIEIVNVLDADSFVDFFSVDKGQFQHPRDSNFHVIRMLE